MTTPTVQALRAELAQLRKDLAEIDADALTPKERSVLNAKIKALASLVAKMEAKNAQRP